ncbi:MAG: hypothetical protein ACKOSQ_12065 [Planctomycetaceae bacterium]
MNKSRRHDDRRAAAFAVECPACRAHVAVSRALVDHVAGCPRCRAPFLVPAPLVAERVPAPRDAAARPATPQPAPSDGSLVFSEPPLPSTRRRDVPAADAPFALAGVSADAAPTPDVGAPDIGAALSDGFAVPERVKTIRSRGVEIELHRLTPEERQARRARRNLIMLVVGAALLVALVVVLGTRTGSR